MLQQTASVTQTSSHLSEETLGLKIICEWESAFIDAFHYPNIIDPPQNKNQSLKS